MQCPTSLPKVLHTAVSSVSASLPHPANQQQNRGDTSQVPRRVRERIQRASKTGSGALEPKILTSYIMKADSAAKVLALVDHYVDSDIFNHFHMQQIFQREKIPCR